MSFKWRILEVYQFFHPLISCFGIDTSHETHNFMNWTLKNFISESQLRVLLRSWWSRIWSPSSFLSVTPPMMLMFIFLLDVQLDIFTHLSWCVRCCTLLLGRITILLSALYLCLTCQHSLVPIYYTLCTSGSQCTFLVTLSST